MGQILRLEQNLETLSCWATEGCGVQFAVPQALLNVSRTHGTSFYCPKGHLLRIGEGEVDKLKRQVENEKQRREWAEKNAATARKAEAIVRGKLKAQSERVKNGVCPCCNRSFTNLRRHMSTKHPEFKP
jgi:hypothetical protein